MQVNRDKFTLLDQVLLNYLNEHEVIEDRWLLEQTLYTGPTRRSIFEFLPFEPHASVLDAGTGFGAFALGLAAQIPVKVHGIDIDAAKLDVARGFLNQLHNDAFFEPESDVQFDVGDLYALPYADNQFDFVVSRLVYQHLHHPLAVSKELCRVTRAGGYVCVVDIDEQFSVSYPPDSDAFIRLSQAFNEVQNLNGGDRYVGRKLATYLHDGGFTIQATAIQPQTYFGPTEVGGWNHQFSVHRLYQTREQIVSHNIMEAEEFDSCITALYEEDDTSRFNSGAQVIVVAQK